MNPRKGFELKESRLIEFLERGFDGKNVLELKTTLERLKTLIGRKGFILILEIPLLSAQEEIGLAFHILRNVV